jgi:hypothetical protein
MGGIRRIQVVTCLLLLSAGLASVQPRPTVAGQGKSGTTETLDYEFFKARVEPIFLKNRPGHARCYACHGLGTGAPQYLVRLSPGAIFWNEEQSGKIFINVSRLVDHDNPLDSRLLLHPLSPTAGGDILQLHSGGRQFETQDDPDWKAIAAWASGEKLTIPAQQ